MAETVFNGAKRDFADGSISWGTGDVRSLLLTGSVTIDPDDVTISDLKAAPNTEASDASYGRVTLTGEAVTVDNTNDRADLEASTLDYGSLDNETPTALVIYLHVDGTDANDTLISIHDTGFGSPANGAGYTVAFPNDVLRIS